MSIEREMAEDSAGVMDVVARPPTERTLGSWTTSGLKFRRPRSLEELLYTKIGLPAAMKRTLETWKAANGTQARF